MMHMLLSFLLVAALAACEGPVGPAGPQGPQGVQGIQGERGDPGEPAPERQEILIEKRVTRSAYDENDEITIRDERIGPETYREWYLRYPGVGNRVHHVPATYLITLVVSVQDESEEWQTPIPSIEPGTATIRDIRRVLLDLADLFGELSIVILLVVEEPPT